MAYKKHSRTEHDGPKNKGRKSGWWGRRVEAKENSRKVRRQLDKIKVIDKEETEPVTQLVE